VELGVLDGYSTLHIAKGIKWLHKVRGYQGKLDAYDLFEDYEFKHGSKEEVKNVLRENGVEDYVNLQKGNAYEVYKNYPNMVMDEVRGVEFLHIDISNTGDIIRDLMELWHPKIGSRGLVMIEGGSDERDNVEWMMTYNKSSIKDEIEANYIINRYYLYGTYFKFPSMTVLLRKWYDE
jgi:predicted O-methyltransferase YrrM